MELQTVRPTNKKTNPVSHRSAKEEDDRSRGGSRSDFLKRLRSSTIQVDSDSPSCGVAAADDDDSWISNGAKGKKRASGRLLMDRIPWFSRLVTSRMEEWHDGARRTRMGQPVQVNVSLNAVVGSDVF